MRKAFVQALISLAKQDERVILLTGDLGFMVLEPFRDQFPDRFINVGAAEQNMLAVATGLADGGYVPFVYSISPFATLRPLEFLRNGPIFHRLPVRVVSVGSGFAYGLGGKSHHSIEDLATLRTYPDLLLVAPADGQQTATAVAETAEIEGPVFYRLDKNDGQQIAGLNGSFNIGRMNTVRSGTDCTIITTGSITAEATQAAENLSADGINATVAIVSSFNPAPTDDLLQLPKPWITVEEHVISGGLGGWVAETAVDAGIQGRILRCGVRNCNLQGVGSQQWFRTQHGIDAAGIQSTIKQFLATI